MINIKKKFPILTLAFIQFIIMLNFIMVMPLGPYKVLDLQLDTTFIGSVTFFYTAGVFFSLMFYSTLISRYNKQSIIIFSLIGMSVSTIMCGLADGLYYLLIGRFISGFISGLSAGPLASLGMALAKKLSTDKDRSENFSIVVLVKILISS